MSRSEDRKPVTAPRPITPRGRVTPEELAELLHIRPSSALKLVVPARARDAHRAVLWSALRPLLDPAIFARAYSKFRKSRSPGGDRRYVTQFPALAREWHPSRNAGLAPNSVSFGVRARVWWKCPEADDHEWQARVFDRVRGARCPFCTNQRVAPSNSLAALRPEVAATWHPSRNGRLTPEEVIPNSKTRVWWRCPGELRPRVVFSLLRACAAWLPMLLESPGVANEQPRHAVSPHRASMALHAQRQSCTGARPRRLPLAGVVAVPRGLGASVEESHPGAHRSALARLSVLRRQACHGGRMSGAPRAGSCSDVGPRAQWTTHPEGR